MLRRRRAPRTTTRLTAPRAPETRTAGSSAVSSLRTPSRSRLVTPTAGRAT
jgi:hypothetical protein